MLAELIYVTPNVLKIIEFAGRVCYKSEDRITDDSDVRFITNLIKRGHESVIEHSNLIYRIDKKRINSELNNYSIVHHLYDIATLNNLLTQRETHEAFYIAGNIRMFKDLVREYFAYKYSDEGPNEIIENILESFDGLPRCLFEDFREDDMMYDTGLYLPQCSEEIDSKDKNTFVLNTSGTSYYRLLLHLYPDMVNILDDMAVVTVKTTMNRYTQTQTVRHRLSSYSIESQRYVNYGDKDIRYSVPKIPEDCRVSEIQFNDEAFGEVEFEDMVKLAIQYYKTNVSKGVKPEDAREILPNCIMSDVIISKTITQWKHFFELRLAKNAQKAIRENAEEILNEFNNNPFINQFYSMKPSKEI